VTLTVIIPQEGADLGTPQQIAEAVGVDAIKHQIETYDVFASIYNPGKIAVLVSWLEKKHGTDWQPSTPEKAASVRQRSVRVVRDYAKYDRREAPQFYPDASGRETLHAAKKCPVDHK